MSEISAALSRVRSGASADSVESSTLDFKTDKGGFKETAVDLAEACVCFANAAGAQWCLASKTAPEEPTLWWELQSMPTNLGRQYSTALNHT